MVTWSWLQKEVNGFIFIELSDEQDIFASFLVREIILLVCYLVSIIIW